MKGKHFKSQALSRLLAKAGCKRASKIVSIAAVNNIHANPVIQVHRSWDKGIRCLRSLDRSLIAKESEQGVTILKYILSESIF